MKSEVYSWRLSSGLKTDLEQAARNEKVSISVLLERMTKDWLARHRADGEAKQARIRARAARAIGKVSIGGPYDNAEAQRAVELNLSKKYGYR